MKVIFYDTNENMDIFIEDNPYCKVRIIFKEDSELFVYYSDDANCKTYINRVVNPKLKPHPYRLSNMDTLSDEAYDYFDTWIKENSNFQGDKKFETIEGNLLK